VATLRQGDYRLSVFEGQGWGELYDLAADPGEFVNLWDVPAAQPTRAALTERLLQEMLANVDSAPLPRVLA
jgi:hypothetical protein